MTPGAADTLHEALGEELALGRRFEELLVQEQQDLTAGLVERLTELGARKIALTDHLAQAAALRRAIVSRAGLGDGRLALERACAQAGTPAQQAMQTLVACAHRVRDLSAQNDALIGRRLQHVRQSLSQLLQSDRSVPLTYSADGLARAARATQARTVA